MVVPQQQNKCQMWTCGIQVHLKHQNTMGRSEKPHQHDNQPAVLLKCYRSWTADRYPTGYPASILTCHVFFSLEKSVTHWGAWWAFTCLLVVTTLFCSTFSRAVHVYITLSGQKCDLISWCISIDPMHSPFSSSHKNHNFTWKILTVFKNGVLKQLNIGQ